jgi:hypothetical protein
VPKTLRIYAFGAALGGQRVLDATKTLAAQSDVRAQRPELGVAEERLRALPAAVPREGGAREVARR